MYLCTTDGLPTTALQGSEQWVLDTGSGIDATGRSLKGRRHSIQDPSAIETGGGNVYCETAVTVHVDEIDEDIEAAELADAGVDVRVLQVGRRCDEQGFEFTWKPFAPKPEFYKPNRDACRVAVSDDYVPYLESDSTPCKCPAAVKRLLMNTTMPEGRQPGAIASQDAAGPSNAPQSQDVCVGFAAVRIV